jgi:hypothetical protein
MLLPNPLNDSTRRERERSSAHDSSGGDETSSLFLFPEEHRSDFTEEQPVARLPHVAVLASSHMVVVDIEATADTPTPLELFAPESIGEKTQAVALESIGKEIDSFIAENVSVSIASKVAPSLHVQATTQGKWVLPQLHRSLMYRGALPAFAVLTLGILTAMLPFVRLDFGTRHGILIAQPVLPARTLSFEAQPLTAPPRVSMPSRQEHQRAESELVSRSPVSGSPVSGSLARPIVRPQPTSTLMRPAPIGPQGMASNTTVAGQRADAPQTTIRTLASQALGAGSESLVAASAVTPATSAAALLPATTVNQNVATPSVSLVSLEENGVRQTVRRYQQAYGDLDVVATAAIWPSVDHRALSRAFNSLKSQDLSFESCKTTMDGSSATVVCRGSIRYVRKVGAPGPAIERHEWHFTLRKLGDDWKIAGVTASQLLAQAAENADQGS